MKKYAVAFASLVMLAGCGEDNPSGGASTSDGAELLETLEGQGIRIHGPLEAPGGLPAFAASAGTSPLAIYIMPDSNYAVIGTLIDFQGNAVVDDQLRQVVSEPMDGEIWRSLEEASWVQDGNPDAERVVYTFSDANCPFCNEFWHAARPWIDAGKVQLRHVMVGVIRPDSAAKAAAILVADNPEEALTYNEQNHDQGGIDPLDTVPPTVAADLAQNVEIMRELGFSGTPGVVAMRDDGSLMFQPGVPRGPVLEALLGPL